jgi:DNA-binding transcriptional LysR family regulator
MQDLNDLYYFVSVVDHGGFAAAGRALGLQKSRLSRRILQVEERLGVRLLNRSSRRFSVTEIGREFYDRCVAMLVEAEAAEQVIAQVRAEPRGVVRVSCPVALLNSQFGALIARFMVANPAVEVHLESTNRRVDVIAEGFDVAIRVRFPPLEPTDLVMRRLDESTQFLVASPALIRTPLSSPSDLSGLPSLDPGPAHRDHQWQLDHRDGQTTLIPHRPRLITDDIAVLREATLAGLRRRAASDYHDLGRHPSRASCPCPAAMAAAQRYCPCGVPVAAGFAPVRPRSARLSRSGVRGPAPARQRRSIMTNARMHVSRRLRGDQKHNKARTTTPPSDAAARRTPPPVLTYSVEHLQSFDAVFYNRARAQLFKVAELTVPLRRC